MDCKHHEGTASSRTCRHCGAPLCEECYDPEPGGCREDCRRSVRRREGGIIPGRSVWMKTIVSILAITGAVTVLLLALCAGLLFTEFS